MHRIKIYTALACALAVLANCAQTPEAVVQPAPPSPEVPDYQVNSRDVSCLAEAVYFEARGTGERGTLAVAQVIVNRAKSPKFPNSICGVVADKCQFSYRCDGNPDVLAVADDRRQAAEIAKKALSGATDITKGSLFFHAAWMPPGWFNTLDRVGQFGGNIFYR